MRLAYNSIYTIRSYLGANRQVKIHTLGADSQSVFYIDNKICNFYIRVLVLNIFIQVVNPDPAPIFILRVPEQFHEKILETNPTPIILTCKKMPYKQ